MSEEKVPAPDPDGPKRKPPKEAIAEARVRAPSRGNRKLESFLKENPNPTRQQLAHGISGNLCRCQDYDKILTAFMRGAEYLRRTT